MGKVKLSPDGSYIVTYDTDDHIHLWNGRDGGLVRLLSGHKSVAVAVAFSPDSLRLATGDGAGTLRIWDLGMDLPALSIPAHDGPYPNNAIIDVAFSRDGSLVATAGRDGTVRLWSARDGKSVVEPLRGYEGWVNTVVFSPTEGELLATAGNDGTVRIWSVQSGKELLKCQGLLGGITSLAFSPDGDRLAAAGQKGIGWIFSTQDARLPDLVASKRIPPGSDNAAGEPVVMLSGHSPSSPDDSNDITSIAFSPDGSRIATAGWDKTVRLWHAYDGRQLAVLRTSSYAAKAVFSPDGMRLAAVGDAFAWVWDARNGRPLVELDREG